MNALWNTCMLVAGLPYTALVWSYIIHLIGRVQRSSKGSSRIKRLYW